MTDYWAVMLVAGSWGAALVVGVFLAAIQPKGRG